MKVRELIEKLKKYDQEQEIWAYYKQNMHPSYIESIEISCDNDEYIKIDNVLLIIE